MPVINTPLAMSGALVGVLALVEIGKLLLPHLRAGFHVKRKDVRIKPNTKEFVTYCRTLILVFQASSPTRVSCLSNSQPT